MAKRKQKYTFWVGIDEWGTEDFAWQGKVIAHTLFQARKFLSAHKKKLSKQTSIVLGRLSIFQEGLPKDEWQLASFSKKIGTISGNYL